MEKSRFESQLDEILEGKMFQDEVAKDYLSTRIFEDDQLQKMSKQSLIQLLNKAFVTICIVEQEKVELINKQIPFIEAEIKNIKITHELTFGLPKVLKKIKEKAVIKADKEKQSKKSIFAANKRHEKTNKAKHKIIEIWATGKYTTRNICAEQECNGLGLSYETARKALRNTPDNS